MAIDTDGSTNYMMSPQSLISCNTHGQGGCEGGHIDRAWHFLRKFGWLWNQECKNWFRFKFSLFTELFRMTVTPTWHHRIPVSFQDQPSMMLWEIVWKKSFQFWEAAQLYKIDEDYSKCSLPIALEGQIHLDILEELKRTSCMKLWTVALYKV